MEKIHKDNINSRDEFIFANTFLKKNIEIISGKFSKEDPQNEEEKARIHLQLVANIAKFYIKILTCLSEKVLKSLNKKGGNVYILNKFLALRQLTETQLKGISQGTWGIKGDNELFHQTIANSKCYITEEEIIQAVKYIEK